MQTPTSSHDIPIVFKTIIPAKRINGGPHREFQCKERIGNGFNYSEPRVCVALSREPLRGRFHCNCPDPDIIPIFRIRGTWDFFKDIPAALVFGNAVMNTSAEFEVILNGHRIFQKKIYFSSYRTHRFWAHKDDAIAMFIQPDEKKPVYYQLGFNIKGIQFHQKMTGGTPDYTALPDWKPAVAVGEKAWTAEMKLPYEIFGLAGRGDGQWRLNMHRVFRNNAVDTCSWNFTDANKSGGPWHNTERFGRLEFSEK